MPFTSFSENDRGPDGKAVPVWFALDEARPLAFFAYSLTKSQDAIRRITKAMRDRTGNLPPLPGIFPDYAAPIVRTAEDGERELLLARWGMPSPAFALKGRKVDKGVTNIRNTSSPRTGVPPLDML